MENNLNELKKLNDEVCRLMVCGSSDQMELPRAINKLSQAIQALSKQEVVEPTDGDIEKWAKLFAIDNGECYGYERGAKDMREKMRGVYPSVSIGDVEKEGEKLVTDYCNDHTPYRGVCGTCGRY